MMTFKISARNLLRNRRRSAMTMLAIAVGAAAMLTFGGFMSYIITGFHTGTVQRTGHLTVFRNGYFNYGTGNPAAYGIDHYRDVMALIGGDPVLQPMIAVLTPRVILFGIAGNFDLDSSRTFFGSGVVPADRVKMRQWNEYGLAGGAPLMPLDEKDEARGIIGVGLARILGLCTQLKLRDCPPPPAKTETTVANAAPPPVDLGELATRDQDNPAAKAEAGLPRLDLLAATAGGAPNVVNFYVTGTEAQGAKELDDGFVNMHIGLAQQLLYGRGEHKVTAIVLQLHRSEDLRAARARLAALFKEKGLDLEVRDFAELTPQYNQVIGLFGSIFAFIAVIMAVIVLFTVVNTMSMSVMERTNEIGTSRAMGVRRRGIRRQFTVEGSLLGVLGASVGIVLAAVIVFLVNRSGLTWTPPGQSAPVPLRLLLSFGPLLIGTWLGLVVMATIASLIPANRAARMPVVDALRHV
jgi:putative ABC transport system permease protein